MIILIFSSFIFFKKKLLIEYPKVFIIPGFVTDETIDPIAGIISKTSENSKSLDTPPIIVPKFSPPPPKVNSLIILYSSSLNPYNFAAYVIIPISKAKMKGISAKGIGHKPNKEDATAEIFIWVSNLFDAFDKKSSFFNTLSKKNISYMLRNLFADLILLIHLIL